MIGSPPAVRAQGDAGRRASPWLGALRAFGVTLLLLIAAVVLVAALGAALDEPALAGDVLTLALPALLAGVLSFLSPCSLPILIGYFSIALQEQSDRIGRITVGFLAGIGTTMAVLGAGFTALGAAVIDHQEAIALVGGVLVIGFGLMSLAGKGFAGVQVGARPAASAGGAYAYGLIFALGWTTCVGPILGSVLTLLVAQGSSVGGALSLVAGSVLSLIYVLGLGLPLFLLVTALLSGGPSGRLTRLLRGRGWEIHLSGRTLYLHSTSMVSGLLLIALGLLLATGQMTIISERLAASPLAELGVRLEEWLNGWVR
jgi:cytochrome c-type biogenesis protein